MSAPSLPPPSPPPGSSAAAPLSGPLTRTVARWVLGPAGKQRVRVSQTLLSLGVFLLFALILQAAVLLGLADERAAGVLTAFSLSTAGGFLLLIRSGLNEALHPPEPSLTLAQMVCAIVEVCGMTLRSNASTWPRVPAGPGRWPFSSTAVRWAPRPRRLACEAPSEPVNSDLESTCAGRLAGRLSSTWSRVRAPIFSTSCRLMTWGSRYRPRLS